MQGNNVKVVSIKELLKSGANKDELLNICEELYAMTDFICEDYPKHKSWFYQKHLPATFIHGAGRDNIFAYD